MDLFLKNICKSYEGTLKETLQDIDLEIKAGEFICVVGPSGCGKTTLLNIIAGLEKPTSGELLLGDKRIEGPGADRVVMFQEAALFPWLSVKENVKFGMKIAGISKEEQEKKAMHYLEMVHLLEFKDYKIHQISGGMRQRTALARALTLDSRILLMDEPFSALDKQTTNMLREELEKIWMETKKTIFFVTHSVEEAIYFADRIIVLSENPGKIKKIFSVNFSRPRQIYDSEFVSLRHEILETVKKTNY